MPIISIVFYMVIIRAGIVNVKNKSRVPGTLSGQSIIRKREISSNDPGHLMSPVQVRVTKSTKTSNDMSYCDDDGFHEIKMSSEEV